MTTERIESILNAVSQRVEKLVPAKRFYVILYEPKKNELSFPLVREGDKNLTWNSRPCSSENALPDLVIMGAKSQIEKDLVTRVENKSIHYWPDENVPQSWLGVPMSVREQVLGALVVESWQKTYSFDTNDEATLTTIARQAAITIDNVRLYEQLEDNIESLQILNKKLQIANERLRILDDVGQQLTRGLAKQEDNILDLIYKSATKLQLDTRNMYIAFYDPDSTKPDTADEIYGMLRFVLEFKDGEQIPSQSRPAQNGLAETVIRGKQSFNPPNVQAAHLGLIQPHTRKIPLSWIGVPMISEGLVFGVIVLRNYELEQVYTEDDQETLGILAGQAAVALQNLRLYQAEQQAQIEKLIAQEQKMAAEKMTIMSGVAAEFAHKMNNLAGTIPVRINIAKDLLNPNNPRDIKIIEQLTKIGKEADGILTAAQKIRQSSERAPDEQININQLLEIAVNRAQDTQTIKDNQVKVLFELSEDLPLIMAERNSLLDTLTSIAKNGYESINGKGLLTVMTRRTEKNGRDAIEIKITDTGRGIPASDLPKIFDLFYTTKDGKGLGFGLWRDRIFIKKLGGEIDVRSVENEGSVFIIRIPTQQNDK